LNKLYLMIGVLVLVGLFALFAPPLYKDKLVGLATYNSNERACIRHYEGDMDDPSSTYLVSSFEVARPAGDLSPGGRAMFGDYERLLNVKVQVKNRLGGYAPAVLTCPLVNGKTSDHETLMYRMRASDPALE
jgi:hypothetical protein